MTLNIKSTFKLQFSQKKNKNKPFCSRNCLFTIPLLCILLSVSFVLPASAVDSEFAPIQVNIETVSSDGDGYSFSEGVVTIFEDGWYVFFGSTTSNCVKVAEGVEANITLHNVNIDRSTIDFSYAFRISEGAVVDLLLVGDNVLKSGRGHAGLEVPKGSVLTINGSEFDSLTAIGETYGAGIGGGWSETGGNITICGGNIIANGSGSGGAGIGGGNSGSGGNIRIEGGDVIATAFYSSAGIGGGLEADGGYVEISGGNFVAIGGGNGGAGIGGGGSGGGGCIVICGGIVTATSGWYGAGIGGGWSGDGGCIVICGGTVTATGDSGGAGIGGGRLGDSGDILIYGKDAVVTANGGYMQEDIGAGTYGVVGNVFVALPYDNLTGTDDAKLGNVVKFSANPATATGVVSVTLPKVFNKAPFDSGIIPLLSGLESENVKVLSVITSPSFDGFDFVFELYSCYSSAFRSGTYLNDEDNAEIAFVEQHNWSEWIITTSVTCNVGGEETRICTKGDNHIETRPIVALEHDWAEGVITRKPTETFTGVLTFTCSHCGDTYTQDIPLLYKTLIGITPSAFVTKLNGNKNDLTITVTEIFSNGLTNAITKTFSINNNAAGNYQVDNYKVYVDTKGNTQIRECYIIK